MEGTLKKVLGVQTTQAVGSNNFGLLQLKNVL